MHLEKTELKPPFWRMFLYFLVCALFVAIGFLMMNDPDVSQVKKIISGYVGMPFFALGAIFFLYKAVIKKPTLTIDSQGIYPNYLKESIRQLIPWKEISKIGIARQTIYTYRTATKIKYLAIYLKNPENFGFKDWIAKEGAQKIASALGNSLAMKGSLYVPLSILPKENVLFPVLRQCPVKFDETIEEM